MYNGADLQYHIQMPQILHLAISKVPDYLLIAQTQRSTACLIVDTRYDLHTCNKQPKMLTDCIQKYNPL